MVEPAPPSTPPDAPPPGHEKPAFGRVLTGTRPGPERVLLASVPSLIAGAVGTSLVGWWAGLLAAAAAFVVVWMLSRGVAE